MINAEQFLVLLAHAAQCVNLLLGVHREKPLRLLGNIGNRNTALWPALPGCYQATDFGIRGYLRLMQYLVNQMSWQNNSFHRSTITSFGLYV
jgi:hypothetical protein